MSEYDQASQLGQAVKQIQQSEKIIIVCGAGISVACGIPDFRSPGTGLYSQLSRYNLPYSTAMFELNYLMIRPRPFYTLTQQIFPNYAYKPSYTHCFFRLLQDKQKLQYVVTQNIDDLEKHVGLDVQKLSQAHGSYTGDIICVGCSYKSKNHAILRSASLDDAVPHCPRCGRVLKPSIVFFGENLPEESGQYINKVRQSDLMVILGTSLKVGPVNQLPIAAIGLERDRILVNNEVVGDFVEIREERQEHDSVLLGDCDSMIKQLCDALGWRDELNAIYNRQHRGGILPVVRPSDQLELIALRNSLVVPDAVTSQTVNFSNTVQFGGLLMFALASQAQIQVLKENTTMSEVEVDRAVIPEQLCGNFQSQIVKVFDKKVKHQDTVVYSPVGGHYAVYLTKYVRYTLLDGENGVWDLITRYQGTKVGERNAKVRKLEDGAELVNQCFVSCECLKAFLNPDPENVEQLQENARCELYTIDHEVPYLKEELDTGSDRTLVKFKLLYDKDDKEPVYARFENMRTMLSGNIKDVVQQVPLEMQITDDVLTIEFGRQLRGDGFEILKQVVCGLWKQWGMRVKRAE